MATITFELKGANNMRIINQTFYCSVIVKGPGEMTFENCIFKISTLPGVTATASAFVNIIGCHFSMVDTPNQQYGSNGLPPISFNDLLLSLNGNEPHDSPAIPAEDFLPHLKSFSKRKRCNSIENIKLFKRSK